MMTGWGMNCDFESLDQKKILLTTPAGNMLLTSATMEMGIIAYLSIFKHYQILFAPELVYFRTAMYYIILS